MLSINLSVAIVVKRISEKEDDCVDSEMILFFSQSKIVYGW